MTTTDDLMVSLTIKPTSNLGRLQKQLEALVGRRGRGAGVPFMQLKRDIQTIQRDSDYIKRKLNLLAPTKLGVSPLEVKFSAIQTSNIIENQMNALINKMKQVRQRDVPGWHKLFGITPGAPTEEIDKILKEWLEQVLEYLTLATKGFFDPNTVNKIITEVLGLTHMGVSKGGRIMTAIERIQGFIHEKTLENKLFNIFSKAGIDVTKQKTFWLTKEGIEQKIEALINEAQGEFRGYTGSDWREEQGLRKKAEGLEKFRTYVGRALSKEESEELAKVLGLKVLETTQAHYWDLFIEKGAQKIAELFPELETWLKENVEEKLIIPLKNIMDIGGAREIKKRMEYTTIPTLAASFLSRMSEEELGRLGIKGFIPKGLRRIEEEKGVLTPIMDKIERTEEMNKIIIEREIENTRQKIKMLEDLKSGDITIGSKIDSLIGEVSNLSRILKELPKREKI